ncbi:hypothetical protein VULLAG_LOCUS7924 [Vulpes lagopus]
MPRTLRVRTRACGGGGTSSTDSAVGLGRSRGVGRATPKEADAGGRAGAGDRGAGGPRGSVKKVGGPGGCRSALRKSRNHSCLY